jgi:hypothetical protein
MSAAEVVRRRRRSPLGEDLWIVLLGSWGFLLQCLKSWQSPGQRRDDA